MSTRKLPNIAPKHTDEILRNARRETGLTAEAAAARLGISSATYGRLEAGATWPHYLLPDVTRCVAILKNPKLASLPKRGVGRPKGSHLSTASKSAVTFSDSSGVFTVRDPYTIGVLRMWRDLDTEEQSEVTRLIESKHAFMLKVRAEEKIWAELAAIKGEAFVKALRAKM